MENFFKKRREALKKSQFKLAIEVGKTPSAIGAWERDDAVPLVPIAKLAEVYEVSEKRMEDEVMAQRRRIEARATAGASK